MRSAILSLFLLVFLILGVPVNAANPSPIAPPNPNPAAPQGGTLNLNFEQEPTTLHPVLSIDVYSQEIHALACDSLLSRDPTTYEFKPRLAQSWEISKDGQQYTFKLRDGIFFHDGRALTAEDVKFTFETFVDSRWGATPWKSYFDGIKKVEVIDAKTIRFTAKDSYFNTFNVVAGTVIWPRHIYSDIEKAKKINRHFLCAGPYQFDKFERGEILTLKKFDSWYGNKIPEWKGIANFSQINIRFFESELVQIEKLKAGEIDFLQWRHPETFVSKAVGEGWGKKYFKSKVENKIPKSYSFIGWNFRRPLFQSVKTRKALALLFDRKEMNKKFRFSLSDFVSAPIYPTSDYAPSLEPLLFDAEKAKQLLSEDGWADSNHDGILDRDINGSQVPFRFTLVYAAKENEKYFTRFKEDLKKRGIDMELKLVKWGLFTELLEDRNFDAFSMSWGGGSVDPDPQQVWHSSSMAKGGFNFISYQNPEVDALIEKGRMILEREKRIPVFKKAFELIADDAPYLFLFADRFQFYATTAKIKKPVETFNFDLGVDTWWMRP